MTTNDIPPNKNDLDPNREKNVIIKGNFKLSKIGPFNMPVFIRSLSSDSGLAAWTLKTSSVPFQSIRHYFLLYHIPHLELL